MIPAMFAALLVILALLALLVRQLNRNHRRNGSPRIAGCCGPADYCGDPFGKVPFFDSSLRR